MYRETFINKASWDRFLAKQNCDYIKSGQDESFEIGPNGHRKGGWIFENGAFVSSDGLHFIDPPTEPVPLAIMQRQFYVALLSREEKNFSALNNKIESTAAFQRTYPHSVMSVGEEDVTALKQIQERVLELHEKINELDEIVSVDPTEISKQERYEADTEHAIQQGDLLSAARQVTIPRRR